MSTKNVWSEFQESSKKIAENNADLLRQSGERLNNAVSNSNHYMAEVVSDMGSAVKSEGICSCFSSQAQELQPTMRKLLGVARENCDATLGIAEDSTRAAEKNLLEVGKVANSMIDEQSKQMVPPQGDMWSASGKQALSFWMDSCNWIIQSSRQGIEAVRSAFAAHVTEPAHAVVTPNPGQGNTHHKK
ncbi:MULTISPECIES: hypothetical protein [Candidatus Ichthyocystis]|uniref:Phasin domain-containing protein n=1 Tax=Candidatus Ichthyocystis hellenicum TaxID=1561003 RepID=A0A0S4M5G7_9BURK|nr:MULTISPECIES: hypothetical protein [Ichthyocystis]CUT17478.1 hypothetical protein Ark11_0642 [Candidatus Ichthyocystis hellenicum]